MDNLNNIGSVIGKNIVNLEDGSLVGSVQGSLIDNASKKVVALKIKQKGLLGSKNSLVFSNVKAFGEHVVTVDNLEGSADGRDIIGMNVITVDGTLMGKIVDFAFNSEGSIIEFILKDGVMKGLPNDRGAVDSEDILTIGKDVVIAKEGIAGGEFNISDADVYGSWHDVDEILADINDSEKANDEVIDDTDCDCIVDDEDERDVKVERNHKYEEHFDEMTDKLNKTISDVSHKIKEIDTDELTDKIKTQSLKLGNEAKAFFDSLKGKFKSGVKEEDVANDVSDTDDESVIKEAQDFIKNITIEKPLLDDEGNVLIWPNQEIDADMLEAVIKANKLDDLKNMAIKKEVNESENEE